VRNVVRGGAAALAAGSTAWWLAGFAVMTVVVATLNWPLLFQLSTAVPGNLGDPVLNVWILTWVSRAVFGPQSLWHPPIFYPHESALAFSEPLLGLVPISLPVLWLTGDAVTAYNVTYLLLAFVTFAGAAALVRELTGRDDAAVIAGILTATSPYLSVAQITRIQMLSCGWSFLALAALHRFLRTGSWPAAAVFAGAYALQALSNTYLGVYLALPVALVVIHGLLFTDLRQHGRRLWRLGAALVTVGVVTSPVALALRDVKAHFGVSRSAAETGQYSADISSYFSVWHQLAPSWLGAETTADRALFHGGLLILLAAAGLVIAGTRKAWWREPAIAYVAVAAVAWALSLGPHPSWRGTPIGMPGLYSALTAIVPGVDALRSPGRFGLFVLVALAVWAGIALATWLARAPLAARVLTLTVCAAVGMAQSARGYDWVAELPDPGKGSSDAYAWLATLPSDAMIELPIVTEYQDNDATIGGSQTLSYQLASLQHGHRLVNGSSGFSPPLTTFLEGSASPLASVTHADTGLRLLRMIGVRYLVLHTDRYKDFAATHATDMVRWLTDAHAHVDGRRDFGATVVFVLRPIAADADAVAAGAVTRLPGDRMTVEATSNQSQLHRLNDDDLSQRWTAPQRVGTRVRIRLDAARPIAGVTLHLRAHSTGDYPRHVRVVGTAADGSQWTLFDGPGGVPLGLQLMDEPREPAVPLWWFPRDLTVLDIDLRSNVRAWQWSVHEIDVWETAAAADGDR
jgi:hypothetical protein